MRAKMDDYKPVIRELPKHLLENAGRLRRLRYWANHTRGFFGHPVYLCGSALNENNPEPRDWDIRIEIPNDEFEHRFGSVNEWISEGASGDWTVIRWRWSNENVRRTKDAWSTGLNVDFQIYPMKWIMAEHRFDPKAKLDTFDDHISAGSKT